MKENKKDYGYSVCNIHYDNFQPLKRNLG